jgi:hypothetical protein
MTGKPVSLSAVEDATSVVETMWKVAKAHGFDEWDAATSSVSGANSHGSADSGSIMSCDPFAASLDPLRSALDLSIPGWTPPVLVTLGNEKSGKSTLLERLALSAFFPTDRAVATRVPVEIMMRRGPMQVPTLSVVARDDSGHIITVRSCPLVAGLAQSAVTEAMEAILAEHAASFTAEQRIRLELTGPTLPNLTLLDLPGLVSAPAADRDAANAVARTMINEVKDHAVFLVTIRANTQLRDSRAMALVEEFNLADRTVGVLTFADMCRAQYDDEDPFDELKAVLRQDEHPEGEPMHLPYGFVATMLRGPKASDKKQPIAEWKRVHETAVKERTWFASQEQLSTISTSVGSDAVITRIRKLLVAYTKCTWVPETLRRLAGAKDQLAAENRALGLPAASTAAELELNLESIVASLSAEQANVCYGPEIARSMVASVASATASSMGSASLCTTEMVVTAKDLEKAVAPLLEWITVWRTKVIAFLNDSWKWACDGEHKWTRFPLVCTAVADLLPKVVDCAAKEMESSVMEACSIAVENLNRMQGPLRPTATDNGWSGIAFGDFGPFLIMRIGVVLSQLEQKVCVAVSEVDWSALVDVESCAEERHALRKALDSVDSVAAAIKEVSGQESLSWSSSSMNSPSTAKDPADESKASKTPLSPKERVLHALRGSVCQEATKLGYSSFVRSLNVSTMMPDDRPSLQEVMKAAFSSPLASTRNQIAQEVFSTLSDLQASLFDTQRNVIAAALRSINEPRQVFAEHGEAAGILPLNGIVQYPHGAIESLVLAWVTRLLKSLVGQQTSYVLNFIRGCHCVDFADTIRKPLDSITVRDYYEGRLEVKIDRGDTFYMKMFNSALNGEEARQHTRREWEELRAKGVLKGLTIPGVWFTLGSGGLFTAVKRDEPGRKAPQGGGFDFGGTLGGGFKHNNVSSFSLGSK